MKELINAHVNRLIEPGPIVMVTTHGAGRHNVMTMGFHMMIQHSPALIGCVIGPWDHSYRALCDSGECVIAIPGVELAQTVVDIGNCSGADVDKFARFSLTAVAAKAVKAPLIAECFANIECRVLDTSLVNRFNLFVLKVEHAWMSDGASATTALHHRGDGSFTVDGDLVDFRSRMVKWRDLQD